MWPVIPAQAGIHVAVIPAGLSSFPRKRESMFTILVVIGPPLSRGWRYLSLAVHGPPLSRGWRQAGV